MVGLRHFVPEEFGKWWRHMDETFLLTLDEWRDRTGFLTRISPDPGALGRDYGSRSSQHFFDGSPLKVADVQPYKLRGTQKIPLTIDELQHCYFIARDVGFTGIGVYPEWTLPGFHFDQRIPKYEGHIATWSARYDENRTQIYEAVEKAWA